MFILFIHHTIQLSLIRDARTCAIRGAEALARVVESMPSQSILWKLFIVLEIEIISSDVTGDKNIEFGRELFKYFWMSKFFCVISWQVHYQWFENYASNESAISLGDASIWPLVLKKEHGSE